MDTETVAYRMSSELLFVCVLLGMVGVVSFILNCLVLRTMIVCESIRNSLFVICSGIAFADILYVILVMPVEIINTTGVHGVINERLCKTITYLSHTAHYVSIYLVVGLTIVRAIFLTTRITPGPTALKGLAATITLWVIGLLANIPMMDYDSDLNAESGACFLPAMIDYRNLQFTALSVALTYGLPVLIIVIVYAVTYIMCRRYCDDTHSEEDKRMARLVTGVVCTFILFWLPLHILVLYSRTHYLKAMTTAATDPTGRMTSRDYTVMTYLHIALSFVWSLTQIDKCIRPLIYMAMSHEFKKSYNEIIDCTLCCNGKPNRDTDVRLSQLQPLTAIEGTLQRHNHPLPAITVNGVDTASKHTVSNCTDTTNV